MIQSNLEYERKLCQVHASNVTMYYNGMVWYDFRQDAHG